MSALRWAIIRVLRRLRICSECVKERFIASGIQRFINISVTDKNDMAAKACHRLMPRRESFREGQMKMYHRRVARCKVFLRRLYSVTGYHVLGTPIEELRLTYRHIPLPQPLSAASARSSTIGA